MDLLSDIENSLSAFGWEAAWVDDNELIANAEGKWCDYQVHFVLQKSINVLYVGFCPELQFNDINNLDLLKFIIAVNQRLWIGHFDLLKDGIINYRHIIHLYNTDGDWVKTVKEICSIMLSEFDLFYPGFQKLQNNISLSQDDIELLSLEIQGKA